MLDIILASPRGFCAGVERAIETVRLAVAKHGSPVYVLHEIVHNRHVLEELRDLGVLFVDDLHEIPRGGVCIFSAHGVSLDIEAKAKSLGLKTIDATCPLVSSVHRLVEKYHGEGREVVIIGHHGHPEVVGTAGRVAGGVHVVANPEEVEWISVQDPERVGYVTQTTLSRGDLEPIRRVLQERFPEIKGPKSNICFATENRQCAVQKLAEEADLIFVVGSKNSSNSNRLREVARRAGTEAYLIDDYTDIEAEWLEGVRRIGITAGASAPERLVEGVVEFLMRTGADTVTTLHGIEERIHFKPAELE